MSVDRREFLRLGAILLGGVTMGGVAAKGVVEPLVRNQKKKETNTSLPQTIIPLNDSQRERLTWRYMYDSSDVKRRVNLPSERVLSIESGNFPWETRAYNGRCILEFGEENPCIVEIDCFRTLDGKKITAENPDQKLIHLQSQINLAEIPDIGSGESSIEIGDLWLYSDTLDFGGLDTPTGVGKTEVLFPLWKDKFILLNPNKLSVDLTTTGDFDKKYGITP